MNREAESHFTKLPQIDIERSKFRQESTHKTTANAASLIPIYVQEILPGDTLELETATVIRESTPLYPVMDNAFADLYYFFVPNRLVYDHWAELNGENKTTFWEQPTEYEVPYIKAPNGGWRKGTLADYMGIPTKIENLEVNALPFRGYAMIWNEFFRDQNLKQPIMINKDETNRDGSNGDNYITDCQLGGMPAKVAKYHDYFTSCLPQPQKGEAVLLPLGGSAPVIGNGMSIGLTDGTTNGALQGERFMHSASDYHQALTTSANTFGANVGTAASDSTHLGIKTLGLTTDGSKSGIIADLSVATGATINALRQAFAVQRLLEKDARGGTRYSEQIMMHFGVTNPDARVQRPEYLGGTRINLQTQQVVQTSSTDATSPQGNVAAYSLTNDVGAKFTKSFTEHGFVLGLMCIRNETSYQQGLERFWSRRKRLDYFWPTLANIGEMGVKVRELYATGTDADDEIFGYQEAWADYKYKMSRVSGAFRSNYEQPLDSWHYADYYTEQPILGSTWIDATPANINRTIAVQDELEDQFICDFYFFGTMVRPMPLYSVPGLIDHH